MGENKVEYTEYDCDVCGEVKRGGISSLFILHEWEVRICNGYPTIMIVYLCPECKSQPTPHPKSIEADEIKVDDSKIVEAVSRFASLDLGPAPAPDAEVPNDFLAYWGHQGPDCPTMPLEVA
ncbi:hypothetical protein LCGC14_0728200 [marine sediment metagenome]|uniref:Uncharacterized protein n=1 Tax=marine sediment metagenome TaxID=412755 RepID=A0A0F9QVD4_9ZZZZ